MRVHDWFEYHARTRPDIAFLRQDVRSLSYGAADARANRWAQALVVAGLKPGDRIAYLSTNDIDMGVMFMACAKAGVAPVMLNYRLAPREWLEILRDADCRMIFVRGAEYQAAIDGLRDDLTGIATFVAVGGEAPAGWQGLDALLDAASRAKPEVAVSEKDLIYLIYTRGTTGLP